MPCASSSLGRLCWRLAPLFGRTIRISRNEALRLAAIGVVLLVGGNGGLAWAEQFVPTGFAALIIAVTPIWFLVLETFVFRGDRMSRRGALGLVMGVVGIAILVWPRIHASRSAGSGATAGLDQPLFSSMSWAIGSVFSRQWRMKVDPLVATGWEMCFAGLAHAVLVLATGQFRRVRLNPRGVMAVFYLVVSGSWVGYTAYVWLLKHVPTPKVATYAYVNPIVAVILGFSSDARALRSLHVGGNRGDRSRRGAGYNREGPLQRQELAEKPRMESEV